MRPLATRLSIAGLLLALAAPTAAQGSRARRAPSAARRARDVTGGVLPGVAVTVTPSVSASLNLFEQKATVTSADGSYRIWWSGPDAAVVDVAFELPGFEAFKQHDVWLIPGRTTTLSVQLELATLPDTVTVCSHCNGEGLIATSTWPWLQFQGTRRLPWPGPFAALLAAVREDRTDRR